MSEVPPLEDSEGLLKHHIERQTAAATAFIHAEAQSILRLALHARSRTITSVEVGQFVYYWRQDHARGRYHGPAKVLAVEKSVIWLAHAGALVRAAPEHLRMATSLETSVAEAISPIPLT
eukprot:1247326-Amphidinium_carterae.1